MLGRIVVIGTFLPLMVAVISASHHNSVTSLGQHLPGVSSSYTYSTPAPDTSDLTVKAAVGRGLDFIVSLQQPDGSWKNNIGYKLGDSYNFEPQDINKPHVGVSALCCMALIAGGHTPIQGKYAGNVALGLDFILKHQHRSGQITAFGSRMYSHAFATLLLAEVFGMTRDARHKKALTEATSFIVRNQVGVTIIPGKEGDTPDAVDLRQDNIRLDRELVGANFGGWRYEPKQLDADMSITVCQLQALRAARNVGIGVPNISIEAAREYVTVNYQSSQGTFSYQPQISYDRTSFALTAAGVVALQSSGKYDSYRTSDGSLIDFSKSIRYLQMARPDRASNFSSRYCRYAFWYGHYYAAQAMHQYKYVNHKLWDTWNQTNRSHFLAMQKPNGAWIDEVGTFYDDKNAYATAMACLILSIPNGYLPIFQA